MRGSASKVSTWRRCQKKAFYAYVLEIERVVQSIAPRRGSIIHKCLEHHYRGEDWTKPISDLKLDLENVFDEEREQWTALPDELYRIVRGYLMTYRNEDLNYEVLATECHFEIPIGFSSRGEDTYEGYIDKIVRDKTTGKVWVSDYKTVGDIPDVTELFMDTQTCMYAKAVALGAIPEITLDKGATVGILFDHVRTKAPRKPAVLKSGGISKAECVTDVQTYMDTVVANGLDPKDYADMVPKLQKHVFFRRAAVPIRKSTVETIVDEIVSTFLDLRKTEMPSVLTHKGDYEALIKEDSMMFPRTYMNKRCSWDCEYYKLCVGELSGMNPLLIIASDYQPRTKKEEVLDGDEN